MFLQPVKFWSILVMFDIKRTLNQAQHSNIPLPNFKLCHLKMNLIISHIYVHGSLGCVTIKRIYVCVALEGLKPFNRFLVNLKYLCNLHFISPKSDAFLNDFVEKLQRGLTGSSKKKS